MAARAYMRWNSAANGVQYFALGPLTSTAEAVREEQANAGRMNFEIVEGPEESLADTLGEGEVRELRGQPIPFEPIATD